MRRLVFLFLILSLTTSCFAIQKNVNSQKWTIFAFDRTDNTAKTGNLSQITGSIWKDGAEDVIADTNPTELAHGYYEFDLDQAETNGDYLVMDAVSATGDIQVVGCPMGVWTTAPYFSALSIDASGRLDIIKIAGTTQTANDMSGDVDTLITVLGALDTAAASGVPTDSDEIMAYVKQLINDTRTTIFHGRGLSAYGVVSTATSVTEFAAAGMDAPHHVDDYFNGWWIYILDADQGAPLHEWRLVSNYASTGGVVTHAAFSVQLEVGDQVLLVNPATYAPIAIDTLTKASGDGDLAAVLTDTEAQDTAGEWDTLMATVITGVNVSSVNADAIEAGDFKTGAIDADALNSDFVAEIWAILMVDIAAGAPPYNSPVLIAVNYLYEAWRNGYKTDGTTSEIVLYKNNGTTPLVESSIADDGTDFTREGYRAPD